MVKKSKLRTPQEAFQHQLKRVLESDQHPLCSVCQTIAYPPVVFPCRCASLRCKECFQHEIAISPTCKICKQRVNAVLRKPVDAFVNKEIQDYIESHGWEKDENQEQVDTVVAPRHAPAAGELLNSLKQIQESFDKRNKEIEQRNLEFLQQDEDAKRILEKQAQIERDIELARKLAEGNLSTTGSSHNSVLITDQNDSEEIEVVTTEPAHENKSTLGGTKCNTIVSVMDDELVTEVAHKESNNEDSDVEVVIDFEMNTMKQSTPNNDLRSQDHTSNNPTHSESKISKSQQSDKTNIGVGLARWFENAKQVAESQNSVSIRKLVTAATCGKLVPLRAKQQKRKASRKRKLNESSKRIAPKKTRTSNSQTKKGMEGTDESSSISKYLVVRPEKIVNLSEVDRQDSSSVCHAKKNEEGHAYGSSSVLSKQAGNGLGRSVGKGTGSSSGTTIDKPVQVLVLEDDTESEDEGVDRWRCGECNYRTESCWNRCANCGIRKTTSTANQV